MVRKEDPNLQDLRVISQGQDGKQQFSIIDLISADQHFVASTVATEEAGDGVANGTSLCTLTVAAYNRFLCTHLFASTDLAATLYVAEGALGSTTEIYVIDLQDGGAQILHTEKTPIFVYDNSGSASSATLRIYVPQTAKGDATNNDINHHFDAYFNGIQYKIA